MRSTTTRTRTAPLHATFVLAVVGFVGFIHLGVRPALADEPVSGVVTAAQQTLAAAQRCDATALRGAASAYASARLAADAGQQATADSLVSQAIGAFTACDQPGSTAVTTDGATVTFPVSLYAVSAAAWTTGSGCVPTAMSAPRDAAGMLGIALLRPLLAAPLTDGSTAVLWAPEPMPSPIGSLLALAAGTAATCHPSGADAPIVLTAAVPPPALDLPTSPLADGGSTSTSTSSSTSTATQTVHTTRQAGPPAIAQPPTGH